MNRFIKFFIRLFSSIKVTFIRFPVVIILLACISFITSLQVENAFPGREDVLSRLLMAGFFGVFLAVSLQFTAERFEKLQRFIWPLRLLSVLITILYYIIMTPPEGIQAFYTTRLIVICFALFAFYLWIPSFKNRVMFSDNALIHLKACFISVLYSFVMGLGLIAIYAAVDVLLVPLDSDIPIHIVNIMGTFFFPLYYLALVPDYSDSGEEATIKMEKAAACPQFLEILFSYIAIPLISIFTLVLAIYSAKILVTRVWPVNELGPMILGYSAAGLLLTVLCGKLDNRFAAVYRRVFPVVLIPAILLQLYSVFIRINAYGVTESRYYLVLFGIYSIACAISLIWVKGTKTSSIAVLAAVFSVLSVIPPADAFSVSRNSQASRIISILERNDMLSEGNVIPKPDIPDKDKAEITNISGYLYNMGHTKYISLFPVDYNQHEDFKELFGFNQYYDYNLPDEKGTEYFFAGIDQQSPLDISGYDKMTRVNFFINADNKNITSPEFNLDGASYTVVTGINNGNEVIININDAEGKTIVSASLNPLMDSISSKIKTSRKEMLLAPADMTVDASGLNMNIRIIMNSLGFRKSENPVYNEISGDAFILIDTSP